MVHREPVPIPCGGSTAWPGRQKTLFPTGNETLQVRVPPSSLTAAPLGDAMTSHGRGGGGDLLTAQGHLSFRQRWSSP